MHQIHQIIAAKKVISHQSSEPRKGPLLELMGGIDSVSHFITTLQRHIKYIIMYPLYTHMACITGHTRAPPLHRGRWRARAGGVSAPPPVWL